MKKADQIIINEKVKEAFGKASEEIDGARNLKQLRSCRARVGETDHYYVLISYNTPVALIEKSTDTLFDGLRLVYGYTATSAQHICKFSKDYSIGPFGISQTCRYYAV